MPRRRFLLVTGLAALPLLALLPAGCPSGLPGGGSGQPIGGGFNLPPTPIITADVVRGIVPLRVQFSSSQSTDDGLIVDRSWDFGDGTTAKAVSPTHTYTTTGDFTVRLTLTDDAGATASRSTIISVTEAPVAVIRVDRTAAEFAPATFSFDGSESFDPDGEIAEYRWDFGDGTREFDVQTPHTFVSPGQYRVRLTVTDDRGVTGFAEQIVAVGIPQPSIEIRIPTPAAGNIVIPQDAPLWVQAVYDVTPGVPRSIRAGLDGDTDPCNAQVAIYGQPANSLDARLGGPGDAITAVAYSPAEDNVALAASRDGTVRLFDTLFNDEIGSFSAGSPVTAAAFAPNGTQIAYGMVNGVVRIIEVASGNVLQELVSHTSEINSVEYSATGAELVSTANDRRAIVWNVADGTVLRNFVHPAAVNDAAFSPVDNQLLATVCADGLGRVFNITSGAQVATLTGHTGEVNTVAFAPDGNTLITGGADRAIRRWNALTGEAQGSITGHTGGVTALTFNPAGDRIASGSTDDSVRIWDAATNELLDRQVPCASTIASLAYSPAGEQLAAGIAARNDVQLDTNPPNGNDLNITIPQPLQLGGVAEGTYFLWAEVDTDRTDPTRTYADNLISVIPPMTAVIDADTPQAPLVDNQASIVVNPNRGRQIIDLGPTATGDLVRMSLLTQPGFGQLFGSLTDQYGLLLLDNEAKMIAWYVSRQNNPNTGVNEDLLPLTRFDSSTKIITGRSTARTYLVIEGGFGANVEITREVGQVLRPQRVFLDFTYSGPVAVGGLPAQSIANFEASTGLSTAAIVARVQGIFADYDITVSDTPPQPPYITVYFGGNRPPEVAPSEYGFSDHFDVRNDTLTGSAIVFTNTVDDAFTISEEIVGTIAARQIGMLLGLRLTFGNPADLMNVSYDPTLPLGITESQLLPLFDGTLNATQDADRLLKETVGS